MDSLVIGLIIFGVLTGSAISGFLCQRYFHREPFSDQTKNILSGARGVIIGLTALTLGLLVAGAKSSYDEKTMELRKQAANTVLLGKMLQDYGPEANIAVQRLKEGIAAEIATLNSIAKDGLGAIQKDVNVGMDKLRQSLRDLKAETEPKTRLKIAAFGMMQDVVRAQLTLYFDKDSRVQWPLMGVLIFWLAVIFFSFGFEGQMNSITVIAIAVSALSMAAAICISFEYDLPYNGLITLSPAPLENALNKF